MANRERLVVIGAGGHGREVFSYIRDVLEAGWQGELIGYLDDGVAFEARPDEEALSWL